MTSEELVERLADIVKEHIWPHALDPDVPGDMARAVLAELAKVGAEDLPSDETVEDLALDILHNHANDDEDAALKIAQAVLRQCHELIAPILAAKDAELARLRGHSAHLQRLLDDADATIEELRAKKGSES